MLLEGSHRIMILATSVLPVVVACGVVGGEAELTDQVIAASTRGFARGGDADATPVTYGDGEGTWAEDGLTVAYSQPPTGGRVSGGVRAEAADTVPGEIPGEVPDEAEARAEGRVTSTLVVSRPGRFRFEVELALRDLELANGGVAWAAVRAALRDAQGDPVPDGRIGELVLELHPDGTVVIDDVPANADMLDPGGAYTTVLTGPAGGVGLAAGRYLVDLELVLVASAPLHPGPNQLAAIGDGMATIRLR